LKALTGREFCRLLEKHGWRLRRVAGSHHIYVHPQLPRVLSVPVHGGNTLK
jgi:predicted RNA binding protein YcfA (HicA-like mRNA interferase family)